MIRGDKLYKVWNAKLETAIFVREDVAPGAIEPTWLVRVSDDGRLCRVNRDYYHKTELGAWQAEITNYREAILQIENRICDDQNQLMEIRKSLLMMRDRIREIG